MKNRWTQQLFDRQREELFDRYYDGRISDEELNTMLSHLEADYVESEVAAYEATKDRYP